MIGDFYGTQGLQSMWTNKEEMETDQRWAVFKALFFFFCSANLIISIVLSITTSPGHIPDDTEWDMFEEDHNSDKSEGQNNGAVRRTANQVKLE